MWMDDYERLSEDFPFLLAKLRRGLVEHNRAARYVRGYNSQGDKEQATMEIKVEQIVKMLKTEG